MNSENFTALDLMISDQDLTSHAPMEVFGFLSLRCNLPGHELPPGSESSAGVDSAAFEHVRLTLWEPNPVVAPVRRRKKRSVGPHPKYRRKYYPQLLDEVGGLESILSMPSGMPNVALSRRGVDLKNRWDEVQKLFYAGFGRQAIREGLDMEELMQEVYLKIAVSNAGRSPFNPDKSSFGHYVHMVCRSAFFNYRQKVFRRRGRETVGMSGYAGGEYGMWDVGSLELEDERGGGHGLAEFSLLCEGIASEFEVDLKAVRMLAEGHKTKTILDEVGGGASLRRKLKQIREARANLDL